MNRMAMAALLGLSGCACTQAFGQDSLLGTYQGNYLDFGHKPDHIGVELAIEKVENGLVTATVRTHEKSGRCAGDGSPMEGKYENNVLRLRTTGDARHACRFSMEVTQEGDKLVGTATGQKRPLTLSK